MCERARRYLKATLPSRVNGYFPRGPQFFYHGQHCVSPNWPVWRRLGISLGFLCEAYCAGLKGGSPGRKQLARFWNNFHDLGLIPILTYPNCRAGAGVRKNL